MDAVSDVTLVLSDDDERPSPSPSPVGGTGAFFRGAITCADSCSLWGRESEDCDARRCYFRREIEMLQPSASGSYRPVKHGRALRLAWCVGGFSARVRSVSFSIQHSAFHGLDFASLPGIPATEPAIFLRGSQKATTPIDPPAWSLKFLFKLLT